MKIIKFSFSVLIFLIFFNSCTEQKGENAYIIIPGNYQGMYYYTRTHGGVEDDEGRSMVTLSDGNVMIVGTTNSIGSGQNDAWLFSADSTGKQLSTRPIGSSLNDRAYSISKAYDGGFLIAGTSNSLSSPSNDDMWIIKTYPTGAEEWQTTTSSTKVDSGFSAIQTTDSLIALLGGTSKNITGDFDVWFSKLNKLGEKQYDSVYGGSGNDIGTQIIQTSDKNLLFIATTTSYGQGQEEIWLVKTTLNGTRLWSKTFGRNLKDVPFKVLETIDGYLIVGYSNSYTVSLGGFGGEDVFLIKTDKTGTRLWDRLFGGSGDDRGYSIISTSDGGFAITGSTKSFGSGNEDVWLIKLDANGIKLWSRTFGGSASDIGYDLVQMQDGGFTITGSTTSLGAGKKDLWLIRTDRNGNITNNDQQP
ncbi:MAG: hypothetical protein O3A55_01530 [Bacteroidetes bacterium]|nr:hypothetical protein [Bacteroidota bacterium]